MKTCPFCAEEIQDAAIVCRYCQRELDKPLPAKAWRYLTLIFNFRNLNEGGWLNAESTPAAMAAQHFWDELHPIVVAMNEKMSCEGWEPLEPRGPAAIQLEIVRNSQGYNPAGTVVNAIFTMGGSLIGQAIGFQKWWPKRVTLRWRKPAEEPKEETYNLWTNPKTKDWERMEKDPDGKWHIWRRPEDYNPDDPNDDRWDKIPC